MAIVIFNLDASAPRFFGGVDSQVKTGFDPGHGYFTWMSKS
jgi:hypothetical protein